MNREKLSAWQIFLDVRNSILKLYFKRIVPNEIVYLQYRLAGLSWTKRLLFGVFGPFVVWTVFNVGICGTLWRRTLSLEPLSLFGNIASQLVAEACATAFHEPSDSLWRMQAPMLYELASLATILSRVGSWWVRKRSEVRVFLIFSNDS